MGWGSYQEDNLDAKGEVVPIHKAAKVSSLRRHKNSIVSQKDQESTEKVIGWIQDEDHNWFLLNLLPLNVQCMDCHAVYIIWYFDENGVPVIVRTGIKNSNDHLIVMRNFYKVKKYADHTLYITWAESKVRDLEGIWTYLCDKLQPLESPRYLWANPIPVDLPWIPDEENNENK